MVMIALIPLVQNDFVLTIVYVVFIATTLAIKKEKKDWAFLLFGFVGLFLSESFFIWTGVETFNRHTLLGTMPLWLPFLWAYAFLIMRRCLKILEP